jgi:hypothetical protein
MDGGRRRRADADGDAGLPDCGLGRALIASGLTPERDGKKPLYAKEKPPCTGLKTGWRQSAELKNTENKEKKS